MGMLDALGAIGTGFTSLGSPEQQRERDLAAIVRGQNVAHAQEAVDRISRESGEVTRQERETAAKIVSLKESLKQVLTLADVKDLQEHLRKHEEEHAALRQLSENLQAPFRQAQVQLQSRQHLLAVERQRFPGALMDTENTLGHGPRGR